MKRLLFVFALMVGAAWSVQAGNIVTDSVKSKILKATVTFNIYLPNGYSPQNQEKYPVVYLLHGLSDNYTAWRDLGRMQLVADELMSSGEAVNMIIVMPGAGDHDVKNTWCGYFNMPGWNYEDFFFQEFIPQVEKKYKGYGDKSHRAVMGLSMGGGGSTVYCQSHPDMFSSCFAMSAWLDNENDIVGGKQEDHNKLYYTGEAVKQRSALKFIENIDEATKAKLKTVNWFFDCGDDDFLFDQSIRLYQLMRGAGIKSELRVRNGVHNWEYWHYSLRMALPFVSRNFGK